MKQICRNEEGTIALEASIALTLFLMLMLTLYSFLTVFQAQYSIEHALLETGKSMALETYATDKLVKTGEGKILPHSSVSSILSELGLTKSVANSDYVSFTKWYQKDEDTVAVAKKRFCSYFAGGETETDLWLKQHRVKDGFSGLDFSGTKVQGDDLVIQVKYKSKLIFDYPAFKIGTLNFTLSTTTALAK